MVCDGPKSTTETAHEWSVQFVKPLQCIVYTVQCVCVFKGPTLVRTYEHFAATRSTESGALALFALDGQVFPTHSRNPKGKGWSLFYDLDDDTQRHRNGPAPRYWVVVRGVSSVGGASVFYTFQSAFQLGNRSNDQCSWVCLFFKKVVWIFDVDSKFLRVVFSIIIFYLTKVFSYF